MTASDLYSWSLRLHFVQRLSRRGKERKRKRKRKRKGNTNKVGKENERKEMEGRPKAGEALSQAFVLDKATATLEILEKLNPRQSYTFC